MVQSGKHIFTSVFLLIAGLCYGVNVDFYGHDLSFSTETISNVRAPFTINKRTVQTAISAVKTADLTEIKSQIEDASIQYNLDGLGEVLLTDKIVAQITGSKNTQSILKYRLLQTLNYDVQLTYTRNTISCFGRLSQKPAASVYILYRNKRYTNLNFNDMRTYGTRYVMSDNRYNPSAVALDYSADAPNINANQSFSHLTWSFQGKVYHLKALKNLSFSEYLSDLPQFDLGPAYVKMSHSEEFQQSVLSPLQGYIDQMHSNIQKANFLLKFAQSAFEYKTDNDQFGHEKYNFPEETVGSIFSDCEDRTILLAFLYKRLLGFESVMLHFEQEKHVCLGVKIPNRSNAYSFKYKNEAFMVCEPTGIGFDVGETGITLKNITEVIELF